jgi:hypothetical protein
VALCQDGSRGGCGSGNSRNPLASSAGTPPAATSSRGERGHGRAEPVPAGPVVHGLSQTARHPNMRYGTAVASTKGEGLITMLIHVARGRLRVRTTRLGQPLRRGIARAMAVPVVMVLTGVAGPALAQGPVSPAGNPAKCLPFPKHLRLNPQLPLPKPPPGSRVSRSPVRACAYLAGSANLRKLAATVPVGPGLSDLRLGLTTYSNFSQAFTYIQTDAAGQFEYHGLPELPPERASFRAFGSIPVSVTIHISEIGSLNLALISCLPAPRCPNHPANFALLLGRVTLRLSDVRIDRVPVNAGSHCQTANPFNLTLTGVPPAYNVAAINGVLTGTVTIPPFKGCGSGGSLDPLFTAFVSGPGNFVKITQAGLCVPDTGSGCPPVKPGLMPRQTAS